MRGGRTSHSTFMLRTYDRVLTVYQRQPWSEISTRVSIKIIDLGTAGQHAAEISCKRASFKVACGEIVATECQYSGQGRSKPKSTISMQQRHVDVYDPGSEEDDG